MQAIRQRLKNTTYMSGIILITISSILFCIPIFVKSTESNTPIFFLNFISIIIFVLFRSGDSGNNEGFNKIHNKFLMLILSLISAYSLNREMNVFDDSANWFSGLLVTFCLNYIVYSFFDDLPLWARHLVSFINGISIITFFYMAAYLMPLYGMGILATILFGVGLHVFVPALFVTYGVILQTRYSGGYTRYWFSFCAGLVMSITFAIFFIINWNTAKEKINNTYQASQSQTELPDWVYTAQHIPLNDLTKKILKSDLVYSTPGRESTFFSFGNISTNLSERKKHDPLIMLASAFSGRIDISAENRIKILRSQFQLRHEAAERLWSGDHLTTDKVKTSVRLWPQCNLSYTEKTITVSNNRTDQSWGRTQEEAIYTFYLSEGAVVSSLSLWIDGKEAKGLLTTKSNADNAYKTIVGVESRDPSVVHWQEGNMVSVRVFPVFKNQSRMFKIGITSPLQRINGKLRYSNINFKGPSFSDCKEEIEVDFEQNVRDFKLPPSFTSMSKNQSFSRKGEYTPEWDLAINDPGLSGCVFNYDGYNYAMSPYHKQLYAVKMEEIYLDLNQSWTREEFDRVLKICAGKNIYVFENSVLKLTEENKESVWTKMQALNFSLFPVYAIQNPEKALLITKSGELSPIADELGNSMLMEKTKKHLGSQVSIKIFNLGKNLNPYLKFLKEIRIFQYDDGNLEMLASRISKSDFPLNEESDERIILHESDIVISKTPGRLDGNGPDHIMRLFAYNHIMHKLGKDLLLDRPFEDSLVQEAAIANIVTPLSSLIVLESQADYDRFNIKNTNGLGNAALGSKGAVPEPHEWALIFLVIGTVLWIVSKRKNKYSLK